MKLSELMAGRTPSVSFSGFVTTDDWVLAVDISDTEEAAATGDFAPVQAGIIRVEAGLNPVTADKQYIREGQSTLKTGSQRTFEIVGDRLYGDPFQDWALSLKIRYGTGQNVIAPYVYFCMQTGKGEQGEASVLTKNDGVGGAGDGSGFIVLLRQAGNKPREFTWAPPANL